MISWQMAAVADPNMLGMRDNRRMSGDRPGPGAARRDPLGDLRERLARLPAGHPSSPDYRPAQERGGEGDRGEASDRGEAGVRGEAGDLAGGAEGLARGEEGLDGGEEGLARGDEAAGEAAADRERGADRAHRRGAARPEGGGLNRPGQSPPRPLGSGLSQGREPYRPWFSPGDEPELWFSPDSGDRSG
jgi:hypothetical protein